MTQDQQRWLTAEQVAERLEVTSETVRSWVRTGKIAVVKLPSGRMRFRPEDVDAILTVQPVVEVIDDETVGAA